MADPSFNPFFIRASVESTLSSARELCPVHIVSIPSSSGHQLKEYVGFLYGSSGIRVSIPSSSGHQLKEETCSASCTKSTAVSIPSSSGHQLKERNTSTRQRKWLKTCFNPFFIRASVESDDSARSIGKQQGNPHSFNPFFIRASVESPWKAPYSEPSAYMSFNPFFIRASVERCSACGCVLCVRLRVSIPSSSGHQLKVAYGRAVGRRTASG